MEAWVEGFLDLVRKKQVLLRWIKKWARD